MVLCPATLSGNNVYMAPFNKDGFTEEMRKIFVSLDIFNLRVSPLEKLVYGLVGLILLAVFGAFIALVVKQPITP